MDSVVKQGMRIQFNEEALRFAFQRENGVLWKWDESYRPYMECKSGKIYFSDARRISYQVFHSGVGDGILSTYRGFENHGGEVPFEFQTLVWVENATQDVYCEWIPICEEGLKVEKIFWPGPMEFREPRDNWYTLLNNRQGMLIPNTWETELETPVFDGFFGTAGAYMPWFAQVREREG